MNELERVELICYFAGWDEVAYWNHYDSLMSYYLRIFERNTSEFHSEIKKLGIFQEHFSKQFIKKDLEILEELFIFDKCLQGMVFYYDNYKEIISNSYRFKTLYKKHHWDCIPFYSILKR